METRQAHPRFLQGVRRRELLKASLVAGVALSARPFSRVLALWAAEAGQPKRGGILRVRGYDPPHFDPHLTFNVRTHTTLSFVYSKLVRYKIGAGIPPGTFLIEPDLAERWEAPDDTTYVFYLRRGVKWHNKPPVNGRELVAEDVKFTFDRFLAEKANPLRYMLEPVDRVEVVDRYTVKFVLKEPYVWLLDVLATSKAMWIIAREVVEHFGDLKKPESAIGTGPFLLEHYEPNVKTVFTRYPDYFLTGLPWVDRVEWLVLEDPSTGLAMYRTGQIDCGPWHQWTVRQQDLDSMQQRHPQLIYRDFLFTNSQRIYMRTDQPPFNDVRVRRAISQAMDRQALIEAVWIRGEPTAAVPRGLQEWSLPIDQLGAGAKYYQYDPKEAKRLLAEAGFPTGLKTPRHATGGYGPDFLDAVQLVQRYLKDVGIEAELKLQEFGAYIATTASGKFEAMAMGPYPPGWEPDSVLYGSYALDSLRNTGHVTDPTLTAMLKAQRRTQDLAARKQLIFDIQRYEAEQQYYVYLACQMQTGSHQPYVKNYAPNALEEYGMAAAVLWLDR
jgi:peptide/nickel transport system substrate-binding protein